MFHVRRNVRSIRAALEMSDYLEVALAHLLELERETLDEIEKYRANCKLSNPAKVKEEPNALSSTKESGDLSAKSFQIISPNLVSTCRNEDNNLSTERRGEKRKVELQDADAPLIKKITLQEDTVNSYASCVKKEFEASLNAVMPETFSAETSATVLELLNKSSSSKLPDTSGTSNDADNQRVNLKKNFGPVRILPESGFVIREHEFFKASIKFRKCFSYKEVEELLAKAGVHGVEDIAIVQKNAIVAFLDEEKLKVLLRLNTETGLRRIKAYSVEKYKKQNTNEEIVKQEKNKKKNKKNSKQ